MDMRDFPEGRLVEFKTSDGITLSGFLASPRNARIGVIHVHGIFSSFYRSRLVKAMASELPKSGIAFMSIETRGSYTMAGFLKGRKRAQLGGGMERFEDCVKDIDAAVKFMKRIGMRRVYLDGISTGTQKITYYAYKKRHGLRGLVLLAPVDDYNLRKKEFGRQFSGVVSAAKAAHKKDKGALIRPKYPGVYLSAQRFLSFTDPKNAEARLFNYERPRLGEYAAIKVPVLSMFGSREQYATKPVRELNRIIARNSRSRRSVQLVIRGGDHGFYRHEREVCLSIIGWIKSIEGMR